MIVNLQEHVAEFHKPIDYEVSPKSESRSLCEEHDALREAEGETMD